MKAAAALRAVLAAGLTLRAEADGRILVRGAPEDCPPELLKHLRARRADVLRLLRGDWCRECGEPIDWPGPVGVIFADGLAAHLSCYERSACSATARSIPVQPSSSTNPGSRDCQRISEKSASLVQAPKDPAHGHPD